MQQNNDAIAPNEDAPNRAARLAGWFLILTALLTLVAVVGRVTADADRETLQETLAAIADNRFFYSLSGAGRLGSGLALIAAAWYLTRTTLLREQTAVLPIVFAVSGLLTTLSGLTAVLLAGTLPSSSGTAGAVHETMDSVHALIGVTGFSAAGLGLLIAARYQYTVGGRLRLLALASALIGAAMQLIWVPGLITLHQTTGSLFFLWLLLVGAMLMTGRAEAHYRA